MAIAIASSFFLGALLGSFATAVAHRLPRDMDWVRGRSQCPACEAQLRARDNLPLVSYLILRGRCASCGVRIPLRYPLAELGLAIVFAVTTAVIGTDQPADLALGLGFALMLLVVTLTDLERRIIPNAVLVAGAAYALALVAASDPSQLPQHLIAAAIGGGVMLVVAIAYPRGMGMGDVKLVAVMGLFLGRAVAPAALVGFALGAIVGLAMIAARGSQARRQTIPFGPFLALGGIVGLWLGDPIVEWYLDAFIRA